MELATERVEKLLALLLLENLEGVSQREKAIRLNLAGFSNVEIADLLQTSSQVVSQYLYESRKKGRRSKSGKKG